MSGTAPQADTPSPAPHADTPSYDDALRGGPGRLVELSAQAVADTLTPGSVLVLPVGSIEQHGPHLPLVTDLLVAQAVAGAAVAGAIEAGRDVWELPALAYTKSDEHAWAAGTVWLDAETLLRTVVRIGDSVAATPARRLVFLNGHGGNTALLQVACREVRRRTGLATFLMPATVPLDGGPAGEAGLGIHAGYDETSLVLYLRPDLVRMDLAVATLPGQVTAAQHLGFHGRHVTFGWLSDDFGPDGVIGDPRGATAQRGGELFDAAVRAAVEALGEIASFDPAADRR